MQLSSWDYQQQKSFFVHSFGVVYYLIYIYIIIYKI